MSLALEAKAFLRTTHNGILSTISSKFAGYPFGSVTPFVLDHDCQPIMLISSIAEHTKNIILNPKVSMIVFDKSDDLQANARLTLLGEAKKLEKDDANLLMSYSRYFPESVDYFAMHDFAFYRIHIEQIRYIAGFGKMGWVSADSLNSANNTGSNKLIAELETSKIEHMNADHSDSLTRYCQHFYGLKPENAQLVGIDSDGFDVKVVDAQDKKILRFQFDKPIFDAHSARAAFVSLSRLANN